MAKQARRRSQRVVYDDLRYCYQEISQIYRTLNTIDDATTRIGGGRNNMIQAALRKLSGEEIVDGLLTRMKHFRKRLKKLERECDERWPRT